MMMITLKPLFYLTLIFLFLPFYAYSSQVLLHTMMGWANNAWGADKEDFTMGMKMVLVDAFNTSEESIKSFKVRFLLLCLQ
jgi:hypothetical protein